MGSVRNKVFPIEKVCSFLQMSVRATSMEHIGIQSKYLNSLRVKGTVRRMNFPYYFLSHNTVSLTKYQQEDTLTVFISASYLGIRT